MDELKICGHCKIPKSANEFYNNNCEPDGLHPWCKECRKLSDAKQYQRIRGWAKEREWRSSLKRRYNISFEDYNALLNKQNGVCAICKNKEKTKRQLCVDHDHKCCSGDFSCGKCIRGLLCSRCNRGLGLLRDSETILTEALNYVRNTY